MHYLSIDLEDWFHILGNPTTKFPHQWIHFEDRLVINADRILKILDKYQIKTTFFVLAWCAERHPRLVKEIVDAGHTIGTHSYAHQLWQDISLPDFRTDLIKSIDILSTITGKPVIHHRAPGFSVNAKFVDYLSCLIEQGIQIDSSIFCTWKVNGGWKEIQKTKPFIIKTDSGSLVEFPIVPYRKFGCSLPFSGGGYFRLWPRFLLQYFSKSAHYVNWYFHPRDFDAQQPLLKDLKSYRKLMSYVGLSGSEKKFENLLSNYSFENYPNDLAKINRINLEELYLPSIVD